MKMPASVNRRKDVQSHRYPTSIALRGDRTEIGNEAMKRIREEQHPLQVWGDLLGYDDAAIAEMVGVRKSSYLEHYITDNKMPCEEFVDRFCDKMGLHPADLVPAGLPISDRLPRATGVMAAIVNIARDENATAWERHAAYATLKDEIETYHHMMAIETEASRTLAQVDLIWDKILPKVNHILENAELQLSEIFKVTARPYLMSDSHERLVMARDHIANGGSLLLDTRVNDILREKVAVIQDKMVEILTPFYQNPVTALQKISQQMEIPSVAAEVKSGNVMQLIIKYPAFFGTMKESLDDDQIIDLTASITMHLDDIERLKKIRTPMVSLTGGANQNAQREKLINYIDQLQENKYVMQSYQNRCLIESLGSVPMPAENKSSWPCAAATLKIIPRLA